MHMKKGRRHHFLFFRNVLMAAAVVALAAGQVHCESSKDGTPEDTASPDLPVGESRGGPDAVQDVGGENEPEVLADVGESRPQDSLNIDVDVGPQPPAPPPYSGGTCPKLTLGKNTMTIDGRPRSFQLYLPPHTKGSPVVFIWHGNGDSGKGLAGFFGADGAAKEHSAILVGPNSCCLDGQNDCCDYTMTWNMGTYSKVEADLAVFDDILTCLEEQYDIDNKRVYTTGFSAGSLWSTYLVVNRAEYLASAVIFSGGTGLVVEYQTPANAIPVLLSWGGEADVYMNMVNFNDMMGQFSDSLQEDGHYVVECDHGLGHTIPFNASAWVYEFLMAHQWGTTTSPFAQTGLTETFPDYCVVP